MNGCCDDFDIPGTCTGHTKCDENFFYCLREFGTPKQTPTRCGENDAFGKLSGDNIDSAEIDFSGNTALGLPNPIPLRNNTSGWEVSRICSTFILHLTIIHVCTSILQYTTSENTALYTSNGCRLHE